jgi:single-strand DNA-binding protein
MNHLNSCILEGEITGLPSMDQTPSGRMVCNFTIESRRYYKKPDGLGVETYHFSIEAWGQLGQVVFNQAKPGRSLRVVGRMKQSRWEGAVDGLPHERVSIVAEHVDFKSVLAKDKKPGERELFAEASKEVDLEDLYEDEETTMPKECST